MTQNDLNTLEGLTTTQAATRLAQDGPNEIAQTPRRSLAKRLLDMLRQPMFALLVTAAVLYMALGDLTEGLTLGVFVLAVLVLTFYQEGKSEASIQALRDLTQPSAQVIRSGQKLQVPARDVVVGDLLLLSEGDRVAADGQLLSANNLQIDESLLTGESVPVNKSTTEPDAAVHAGSFVVRGQGLAQVTATGSQMGASLALALPALWWHPQHLPSLHAWAALLAVGIVCTGVAYILYFKLIENTGPAKALTVTFMVPVFAIVYGVVLLGETVTPWMLGCGLIVLLGTALSSGLIHIGKRKA